MRILGIELGAWSVKAVEMESRWRRLEVLDLHEIALPLVITDPVATYKKAVENLLGRLPSHPDKIVTSLPPTHTSLRFLHLPIKQRKKVEQNYRFELEDTLPFALENTVVEHTVFKTPEGHMVLAAIAPKDLAASYLGWLGQIGIDPDWLTFEGMGLLNFFQHDEAKATENVEAEEGATLLLDIGHGKTNLAILQEKRVEFFRSIAWGGYAITQAISGAFDLELEQAEEKKIKELRLDIASESTGNRNLDLYSAATQSLTPLMTDIQHSIVTYRSQRGSEISKVIVAGGTARTSGFTKFLSQQLGRPVSLITDTDHISIGKNAEPDKSLTFGEVVGRGIVFSRKSPFLFNFRKQELAKKNSLTEAGSFLKDPNVIKLLRLAAVLIVILVVHILFATPLAKKSAIQAEKEVKKAFQLAFRGEQANVVKTATQDPKKLQQFIDSKLKAIKDRNSMVVGKRMPMLKLLKTVTGAFSGDVKVDVNKIRLDDRNLALEGVVYSGDINTVVESLKKLEGFEKVSLSSTSENKRFTIQGEIDREIN